MPIRVDLTKRRYNRWTFLSFSRVKKLKCGQRKTYWMCKCDCGTIKEVYNNSIVSGKSLSCGCIKRKLEFGQAAKNNILCSYKGKCHRKSIEFKLTNDQFFELMNNSCFYCGKAPENNHTSKKFYGNYIYSGIDRIDNNQGYIINNVVSSCKNCNLAKRSLTQTEFLKMVFLIYKKHCEGKE